MAINVNDRKRKNSSSVLIVASLLFLLLNISVFSQPTLKPITKQVILKTNLLNLIAKRPSLTLEKFFSATLSTEVSFVDGEFNNLLLTDHYAYNGFLIRVKKYFSAIEFGEVNAYAALYGGNLKRTIQTAGQTDNSGYWSFPSRNFSANSIRAGGSLGLSYISRSRLTVDGLIGLGYGGYTKVYKTDATHHIKGYLDAQIWLSVGYCF